MTRESLKPARPRAVRAADRDARSRRAAPCAGRVGARAPPRAARAGSRASASSSESRRTVRATTSWRRYRPGVFSSTMTPIRPRIRSSASSSVGYCRRGARRLVRDDEPAVRVGVDVELDVVGADLDRALERGQRVLGQLGRGAAVRYDKHRSISVAVDAVDELVRVAAVARARACRASRSRAARRPSRRRCPLRCPRRRARPCGSPSRRSVFR